jgi:hypothetical protein
MHTVTVEPISQGRAMLTCDYPLPALVTSGEKLWAWIGWTFLAYWGLFVAGAVTGHKELNSVGGMMLLAVLAWGALDRLWVRADSQLYCSIDPAPSFSLDALTRIGSGICQVCICMHGHLPGPNTAFT